MSASVSAHRAAERSDRIDDQAQLEAGLAIAARASGLVFVELPAPIVHPSALVDEFRDDALVAWSSSELGLVGIGVARELRGAGSDRWGTIVQAARTLAAELAVVGGAATSLDALGFARPRLIGGAAFAPGAADRAPWHGFGDAWFVLPRWTYVHDGARARLVLAIEPGDARDPVSVQRCRDELAILRTACATQSMKRHQPQLVELHRASAAEWRQQVESITAAIANGTCSKIVAARTCSVALAGAVRTGDLLAALDERHADCVRVLVRPPHASTLVAATPERLVRRVGDLVSCDALAGTRSIGSAARSDRDREVAAASEALLASTKDRREHDLVVDAIRAALEPWAGVDAPVEPLVRVLRHVVHLHTPFRATLHEPHHILELVARLHPTPAVGGTPRETAVDWIRSREPVARGWYAAPVGWFDLAGDGEFAVAIRSGLLAGQRAHLWAGAGIVAGSDPDRELAETEDKLRAMLGALGVTDEPDAIRVKAGAAG